MNELYYIEYTLPNGRKVYLTQRPDRVSKTSLKRFVEEKKPAIRFQLTDDYVENLTPKIPYHWYLWSPQLSLKPESVFPFLVLIDRFDQVNPTSKPIWIHCDSSTMRAPTFFGLWLRCAYGADLKRVEDAAVQSGDRYISSLEQYSLVSMKQDPGIAGLVGGWIDGGEAMAHSYLMSMKP